MKCQAVDGDCCHRIKFVLFQIDIYYYILESVKLFIYPRYVDNNQVNSISKWKHDASEFKE